MDEPGERFLNEANVIRLLLGVVGFLIALWLYSQQSNNNQMARDLGDIKTFAASIPEIKQDIRDLRSDQSTQRADIAALKDQSDKTDRALDKLLAAKQMNIIKREFRRKQDATVGLMQKQEQHYKREIARDDETIKRQAIER